MNRYKPTVLVAIEPNFTMFESDEIPDTNEKKTNGTTTNISKFLNIWPPRLKTYFSTKSKSIAGIAAC